MPSKSHQVLLENVTTILQRTGYSIIILPPMKKACFDIIAKKKDSTLIIKISPYIDSFTRDNAYELNKVARFLDASPLIIGIKGRRFDEIDEGLVLLRYGIPVISPDTFLSLMVHKLKPLVICNRGGYYVIINRNILRKARIDKNLSYGDLAKLVGVSRRTIYEYEHSINPPPDVAARLEEILETPIVQGVQIFELATPLEERENYNIQSMTDLKEEVSNLLKELGILSQFWMTAAPFDAFGIHQNNDKIQSGLNVLVCVEEDENIKSITQRATITQGIASLTKRRAIMVVEEEKEDEPYSNIPTFTVEELKQMKRAFELVKSWVKKYENVKKVA